MTAPAARVIGLDGEMSGAEIEDGHKLIQIGVAIDTTPDGARLSSPALFCSLIGWPEDQLPWSARAASVHAIPREAVLAAPPAGDVDDQLYDWLLGHGLDPANRGINRMCGFNVGVFDSPFVNAALPRSASLFSRRYNDLNPVVSLLSGAVGLSVSGTRQVAPAAWKRRITNAGLALVASTGRTEAVHDAGTDALIALGAWRYCEDFLADLDAIAAEVRRQRRAERKAAAG